jgi:hypothetical protein
MARPYVEEEDVVAAVTWGPHLSKARAKRGGKLNASSADMPGMIVDILTAEDRYFKGRPTT